MRPVLFAIATTAFLLAPTLAHARIRISYVAWMEPYMIASVGLTAFCFMLVAVFMPKDMDFAQVQAMEARPKALEVAFRCAQATGILTFIVCGYAVVKAF